jgi:hypothetical protein
LRRLQVLHSTTIFPRKAVPSHLFGHGVGFHALLCTFGLEFRKHSEMPISDNLSTPTRGSREVLFPSSPDSLFSSPNHYRQNPWTPGRVTLWPAGLGATDQVADSSPGQPFSAFQVTPHL